MNTYKTRDINLAGYLLTEGVRLISTETSENPSYKKSIYFIFEDELRCNELELNFVNGTANCNIKKFIDSLQTLKSIIYK